MNKKKPPPPKKTGTRGRPARVTINQEIESQQQRENVQPRPTPSPPPSDVNDTIVTEAMVENHEHRGELVNSTTLSAAAQTSVSQNDPIVRLVGALEDTLRSVRENSLGEGNSRLVNRLTTAKGLPSFNGNNPLEFLHFKQAYNLSSELGGYSDLENVARLSDAIKGDTRDVVGTLLAVNSDPREIMNSLEMEYGNARLIAVSIKSELESLPHVESENGSLIRFATKLKNAITAFKFLKLNGYLYNDDLLATLGKKLPSTLKYNFNKYAEEITDERSDLEKLSEYLYLEAKRGSKTGLFISQNLNEYTLQIIGQKKSEEAYALLDEGSTITLIDKDFAHNLGLNGIKTNITLTGINSKVVSKCEKVNFTVIGDFGENHIKHALIVEHCKFPMQTISRTLLNQLGEHIKRVELKPYYYAKVKILIGQDNLNLIATREFIQVNNDLAISRSLLGWALHGTAYHNSINTYTLTSANESSSGNKATSLQIVESDEKDMQTDEMIKYFFELESIGVSDNSKPKCDHDRAINILESSSKFNGDAWETGMLWKSDIAPDVDSRATAMRRMLSLERRLDRDPALSELVYLEMERMIEKGYLAKVSSKTVRKRVWYVPIFPVHNINRPNKVRLVHDCAAKTNGISLNDQLAIGPVLLKSLPGILIRFRQHAIAVKGDITDMFLRIKIVENDRAIRSLYRGKDRNRDPDEYEATGLIFGAASSPATAIYIKNKNAERYQGTNPEAVRAIIDDTYVDDLICSVKSEIEAITLINDVGKINSVGGFQMHGWASNSPEVLKSTVGDNVASKIGKIQLNSQETERVLGIYWDMKVDELNVKLAKIAKEILSGEKIPTKRQVLSVIMSIYDPLGLVIPFALKSKVLMQAIHRSGIPWDTPVRKEEHEQWLNWLSSITVVKECQIPRRFATSSLCDKAQLHVFCDASLLAFAAAAYLRFESPNGGAHTALVMAKSRLASGKSETIPRLELQAALLGSRLAKFLKNEIRIKITRRYFWSDSSTVIQWIRSEPREHNIFVANRLGEIATLTHSLEWKWIPTADNPADDATRIGNDALKSNSRWFNGPNFLNNDESTWPVEKFVTRQERNAIGKLEPQKTYTFTIETNFTNELPSTLRMLGWQGLLIHARRVRRMFEYWREKAHARSHITRVKQAYAEWKRKADLKSLVQRTRDNENYLHRKIQAECFKDELRTLKNVGEVNKQSRIAMLSPYLDDDHILRANGRANAISEIENCNNTPIIHDGRHSAVKLLVATYHRKYYHGSNNTVINEIRQSYYITRLRVILRSLINRCIVCRLRRGKAFAPMMAPLPEGRLAVRLRPFSHCGVDYFGPMLIKIGRRREKRWGVLFTCLTVRAIHLELAHTLNTSSAIMALQRLSARRGAPLVVYSDNGTNFRGAVKELKDAIATIDQENIAKFAETRKIDWRFNPPDAPHMGGAWERLIRSVKTALNSTLQDQAPSEEVLYTVLNEIEHSVNSRPLTDVSLDPRDNEALTPNHFLLGSSSGSLELGKYHDKNLCLRKEWKLAQHYADAFWKRWLREYLPDLLPRRKWTENEEPLKEGDVVLIVDFGAARNIWKRGIVVRVFPGKDKRVRVAEVNTSTGNFTRPAHKLVKLLGVNET